MRNVRQKVVLFAGNDWQKIAGKPRRFFVRTADGLRKLSPAMAQTQMSARKPRRFFVKTADGLRKLSQATAQTQMSARKPRRFLSEKIPLPQNMRGMALILVLWMIVLLVLMASGFAFAMRSEAVATQTSVAQIKAGLHVDGAIERAVYELARPKVDPNDGWKADGTSYPLTEDEADLTVTIVDESSFIDINAADEHTLKRLFERVGGVDARTAESIVNALLDWRDADDLTRPFGAEAPEYRAAHKNHAPSNTSFRTQEELGQVLGVTPQIYANVAPFITVYSKTAAINTTTAPREVLLCLPQADEDSVDRYIEDRRRARDQGQALPLFHGMGGKSPIWRITATLKSDEGFTLTRTAIIRYTGQSSRPFLIYDWRDA